MRTPGQDLDLTTGFLFTEGIISGIADIQDQQQRQRDVVNTSLKSHVRVQPAELQRHFYTTSSCGVCGKTSIDMVKTKTVYRPHTSKFSIKHNVLWRLQQQLKSRQILFNQTGGIHAAGLFNNKGELVLIREDVGRHNAVDKLIGAGLKMNVVPLYEHFIMVSGRASFELIQKASMAGLPMLVAVGAPSSLAVELAEEQGMTLIGFLK
ncbi:UNVERIFIED_CONTAM: hypothetical protein GTU68_025846, partial [Idotea baltica]|nr:hypothetical protein [Idotea baltica]